jgi:hypothetical protein
LLLQPCSIAARRIDSGQRPGLVQARGLRSQVPRAERLRQGWNC